MPWSLLVLTVFTVSSTRVYLSAGAAKICRCSYSNSDTLEIISKSRESTGRSLKWQLFLLNLEVKQIFYRSRSLGLSLKIVLKIPKRAVVFFFDHLKYNKDPFLFHDFIAFPHFSVLTFFFDKSSMTIKLNLP